MKKAFVLIASILGFITIWALFFRQPAGRDTGVCNKTLIVGTNAEYPPFTFVQNGAIVGFDVDIMKEVCKRLGLTMKLKDMSFDILVPEVQRGSVDLIAAGMTPTPERSHELIFTDNYFTGDPLVIVSLSSSPITTLKELMNVSVVVNDGYTADVYMSEIAGVNLIRLPNPAGAFLALESGRAAAYVTAQSTVSSFLKENKDKKFSIVPLPETEEKYAFALSPKQADLLPKINNLLAVFKEEGLLQKLKEKWGLAHD